MDFGLTGTKVKLEPSPTKAEAAERKKQLLEAVENNGAPSPKVSDARELLSKDDTPKNENNNNNDDDDDDDQDLFGDGNDNDEEEETFAENNCGSPEDREFDALIGAIETFIVSDELAAAKDAFFAQLPQCKSLPEQERYIHFKKFEELVDGSCDEFCRKQFPGKDMTELGEMIAARAEEVSEDVMEVIGGGLDYQEFVQLWEQREQARVAGIVPPAAEAAKEEFE